MRKDWSWRHGGRELVRNEDNGGGGWEGERLKERRKEEEYKKEME